MKPRRQKELVRTVGGVQGPPVAVRREKGGVSIAFPAERFSDPTEGFIADWADAVDSPEGFKLLFAKSRPITGRAQVLVEVIVAARAFVDSVWPTIAESDFLSKLATYCETQHGDWKLGQIEGLDGCDVHFRRANVLIVWYSVDEAIVDFHLVSTPDVARVIQGEERDVRIDPMLRVSLSTPLLRSLLVKCGGLVAARGPRP